MVCGLFLVHDSRSANDTQTVTTSVPGIPISKDDYASFTSYWTEHITQHGAEASYQSFKETYADDDPFRKHDVAHTFSSVLFEIEGPAAIQICDDDYSHGCFHEVLAATIETEGPAVLPELDAYCKTSEYDCQHGIGHGLIALEGYDEIALWAALEHCQNLGSMDVRDGCYGGIFMEYNLRTMEGVNAFSRKYSASTGDPTCSLVPSHAQTACNFWLAQWFMSHYDRSDNTGLFDWTYTQCMALPNQLAQQECVNGLGYEIGGYVNDIEAALSLCDSVSTYPDQCTVSVLAHFNSALDTRDSAYAACTTQTHVEEAECIEILNSMAGERIPLLQI